MILNIPIYSFASNNSDTVNVETLKDKAVSFLKWYLKKIEKAEPRYRIVDGIDGDSTHPYRVNYKGAKRYIDFLAKSKMLSSQYLDSMYAYFQRCDANFVKYHQYYYVAFGFDMDLVLKTQDYFDIIPDINKGKVTKINRKGKSFFIEVVFGNVSYQPFTFEFSLYNGKWLIDKINGDFSLEIDHYLPVPK